MDALSTDNYVLLTSSNDMERYPVYLMKMKSLSRSGHFGTSRYCLLLPDNIYNKSYNEPLYSIRGRYFVASSCNRSFRTGSITSVLFIYSRCTPSWGISVRGERWKVETKVLVEKLQGESTSSRSLIHHFISKFHGLFNKTLFGLEAAVALISLYKMNINRWW